MTNNIRTIYLYIVSFITLGMIIGGIASVVNNITSYYYPESYIFFNETNSSDSSYVYDYSESNERKIQRENYKSDKIKNAIVSGVVVTLGIIMYKYHWNIIEKERINKKN